MRNTANQSRRQYRTIVVAICLGVVLSIAQRAAAAEPAVDAKTETVSVYLNVEKDGKLISGLQRDNFRLSEDGRSREFRLEKPEEPASIAFLIEYSASSSAFLEDISYALDGFKAHGIDSGVRRGCRKVIEVMGTLTAAESLPSRQNKRF